MLTNRVARPRAVPAAVARSRTAVARAAMVGAVSLAATVSAIWAQADAGEIGGTSCVGSWRGYNCVTTWGRAGDPNVRVVPGTFGDAEKTLAEKRDRKWMARCRPVVEPDRYGVPRYHYAAPGCEFGVGQD